MSDPKPVLHWFKVPDDIRTLTGLRRSELRCYLEVLRAIQRDKNKGQLSHREIAKRVALSPRHTLKALNALVVAGLLVCEVRPGAMAVYRLPFQFAGPGTEGTPAGQQIDEKRTPAGSPECVPEGLQERSPTGNQTLENKSSQKERAKLALPPPSIANEFGRMVPNPNLRAVEEAVYAARDRLARAKDLLAYEQRIIGDVLRELYQ
jgi:hypothetical protein